VLVVGEIERVGSYLPLVVDSGIVGLACQVCLLGLLHLSDLGCLKPKIADLLYSHRSESR
jgi:hypothetical protein